MKACHASWGVYPDWGYMGARFSQDFRDTVGFLLDDGDPCGTAFVIQCTVSPPDAGIKRSARFIVTARHCLKDVFKPGLRYRGSSGATPEGDIPEWPVPLEDWVFPEDDGVDLALAPFSPPAGLGVQPRVLPMDYATSHVGRPVELGEAVYYVGMFDVSAVANRGAVPVVRSGTVAAMGERQIKFTDKWGKVESVLPRGHLIDIRPRKGFSGSPVFVQRLVAREWTADPPAEWRRRARQFGTNVDTWMEVATFTDLWGVWVGLADESGIGVVVPVEDLVSFLESDRVEALMMKEKTKQWDERPGERIEFGNTADAASDDDAAPDFLADLDKATDKVTKDDEG